MKIDNSKYGGWLQAGTHLVTITDYEVTRSESRGCDVVIYTFMDKNGHSHRERFNIEDKWMWRLVNLSIAAGLPSDAVWEYPDIIGKQVNIRIIESKSGDKTYHNARDFSPATLPQINQSDKIKEKDISDDSGPDINSYTEDDFPGDDYSQGGDPF